MVMVHLRGVIENNELGDSVIMPGSINDSQLAAYYRTAHLFWSMSEHEGFCMPLIEAMWFDIPVLAYRSTAVPETLGDAALMFTDKGDLHAVAAMASLLITDRTLRQRLINARQRRRAQFLPEQIRPFVFHLLGRLSPSNVAQPDIQRR